MIKTTVNLEEWENKVINITKKRFKLKTKSETIRFIINKFEEEQLRLEIKPEYLKKLKKIRNGKYVSGKELRKIIES